MSNFNTEFDLGLFIYIIKRNLLWILLIFGVVLAASFLYIRYTSPIFMAETTIQIKKSNKANQLLKVDDFYETNDISAEIELLRSNLMIQNAIQKLPLEISYFTEGQILSKEVYKYSPLIVDLIRKDSSLPSTTIKITFKNEREGILIWGSDDDPQSRQIRFGEIVELPFATLKVNILDYKRIVRDTRAVKPLEYYFVINNMNSLVRDVRKNLDISIQNVSANTIKISYSDNNRLKAKDIVSEIVGEFQTFIVEKKKQSSRQILQFLNDQIEIVYEKQKAAEQEIQRFKREHNISDVDEVSSVFVERMNQLDEARVNLEIQLSLLEEIKSKLDENDKIDVYELLPILVGTSYEGSLSKLVDQLNNLLLEKQKLLYTSKAGSDPVQEINYQIDIQKTLIIKSIISLTEKLRERLEGLNRKATELENEYFNIPDQEVELLRLKRTYDINEKFYTLMLEKKTEYSISQEGFVSNVNILDEARIPQSPISPNKELILASFLAVGLFLSLILVIVKYLFHNQITSIGEILKYTHSGVSLLGVVPKYKKDIPISQLIVNKNPKSLIAESFRAIRTNLQFISKQSGPKIMAVTSTVSGEGKTFIAINLGGIIAYSGKKGDHPGSGHEKTEDPQGL